MQNDGLFEQKKDRIGSPDQLNRYMKVVTPGVGLVLATMIIIALGVICWGVYGTIPVTLELDGAFVANDEDGVFDSFIVVADAVSDAPLISGGMEVQLSPAHAPRDEYGYITGTVASVSTYPASEDEIIGMIGNAEMAKLIMPEDAGKLVTINLERDETSQNGLNWTHENGKGVHIDAGTLATAMIIIEQHRPIDLVLEGD
ncbi:MAG: hypothetical protein Q4D04_03645 [Clostridia bacterium]|nr:hypothetical protein [Clostridia bacterium]